MLRVGDWLSSPASWEGVPDLSGVPGAFFLPFSLSTGIKQDVLVKYYALPYGTGCRPPRPGRVCPTCLGCRGYSSYPSAYLYKTRCISEILCPALGDWLSSPASWEGVPDLSGVPGAFFFPFSLSTGIKQDVLVGNWLSSPASPSSKHYSIQAEGIFFTNT